MAAYVLRRLGQALPVLFIASVAVWLLIYLIPGDPALALLGPDVTPEQLARARARMGLDQPWPVQYALWLGRVLEGDLGVSYLNGLPVRTMLAQRIPVTLQLTLGSLVVALLIAAPLGILSAARPRTWLDRLASGYNALAMAVPTFWLGILLVLLFGLYLRWLPTSGYVPVWEDPARALRFLVLPAVTLGAYVSAVLARFTRAALAESLGQDYVRTARAKGLGEAGVVGVHALKNALIPVVTVLGLQFGAFMGGAVITEAIFDYPGLGRMLLQAILTRDYTVVQGTILFVVSAFVVINLLTDLAYAYLDPRIRYTA
jgi:peptide/nickel transport system permease protein